MYRSLFGERLVAVGDSHIDMFTFFCESICRVVGASAFGLTNNYSVSNARKIFFGFLQSTVGLTPLICIGEVDCNSVAWRHKSIPPQEAIHISINNLLLFLKETGRKFIISSVILPPVNSYEGLHIRKDVKASKEERSALVKEFNQILRTNAINQGHYFLDITTPTTNGDGFVDKKFIVAEKDVHLSPFQISNIVREELNKAYPLCKDFV